MMGTEDVTRETALKAATEFLAAVFPKHYAREGGRHPGARVSQPKRGTTMKKLTRRLTLIAGLACALSASAVALGDRRRQGPDVFDWAGYEDPSFHQKYIEKNGDAPTFAFFGDEDEAFEKLRSGFKADLAPSLLAKRREVARGRAAAAARHLEDRRLERPAARHHGDEGSGDRPPTARPGSCRGTGATPQLTYNSDKIDEKDVQSLKAFADPKFEAASRSATMSTTPMRWRSLAIGLKDWTKMTDEQFKQASDFLRQVHKNVRPYWTDTTDDRAGAEQRRGRSRLGLERCDRAVGGRRRADQVQEGHRRRHLDLGLRLCAVQGRAGQCRQGL